MAAVERELAASPSRGQIPPDDAALLSVRADGSELLGHPRRNDALRLAVPLGPLLRDGGHLAARMRATNAGLPAAACGGSPFGALQGARRCGGDHALEAESCVRPLPP